MKIKKINLRFVVVSTIVACLFFTISICVYNTNDAFAAGINLDNLKAEANKIQQERSTQTYTTTFDGNGHSGHMDDKQTKYDEEFTLPSASFSCGFWEKFKSWSADGQSYKAGDKVKFNKDITLKATYELNWIIIIVIVFGACFLILILVLIANSKRNKTLEYSTNTSNDINAIVEKINQSNTNRFVDSQKENNVKNSDGFSVADEISKFKKLLDDGIITQDEFDKKKSELLNS